MTSAPIVPPAPPTIFCEPGTGRLTGPAYRYLFQINQKTGEAAAGTIATPAGSGLTGGGAVADGVTLSVAANGITDAMLRQSQACSVIGRYPNSAGNVADIVAVADDQVLGRFGGQLVFQSLSLVPSTVADGDYTDITVSSSGTVWNINAGVVGPTELADTAVTPGTYGDAGHVGQFTVDQQGRITAAADVAITAPDYGQFYDTTTQTAAIASAAYAMTFNTTVLSSNVTIGTPASRVVVANAGIYLFSISAQFLETGAGSGSAWYWYRINGTDETYSASRVSVSALIPAQHMADATALSLSAGDYVEIMWATDDTNIELTATAAAGAIPGIPSITLSVNSLD